MKKLWITISVCWLWTCGGGGGSPTEPLQPPVVQNINLEANEDTPKTFTFVGTEPNNLSLTYSISTQPQNGAVQVSGSAGTYTPNENFNGQDTFLYIATSSSGNSNIGTVLVNVSSEDDQPIFISQSLTTEEDTNLKIVFEYEEFDGQDVKFSWGGGASHGTVTFDDQSCTQSEINDRTCDTVNYGPNGNYFGTDNFGVTIEDFNSKRVLTQSGINITITPVNDAPIVVDIDAGKVQLNQSIEVTLQGSDVENDNLTYSIVSQPSYGNVAINGSIATYTPNSIGEDSFTYQASDGIETSNEATISIIISGWSRTFGGEDNDDANSILQTSDGGYLLGGYTYSFGNGSQDMYLVKTDADGNEEWSRTLGGPSRDTVSSVFQTSDGGYILGGYTNSFGNGSVDMYLVKTDAVGNEEWSETYGGPNPDGAYSTIQTSDGGYALGGLYENSSNGNGNGDYDVYLKKTDANGNHQWASIFGAAGTDDVANSILQTSNGGYALGGHTASFGNGQVQMYLVITNANGQEQWSKTFGGAGVDYAYSILQTSDGGYVLGGITSSFSENGLNDMYLVKTDAVGNEEWSETYGGINDDGAYSILQTSDGGYLLGGYSASFGNGSGDFDLYLVKTDANGNEEWSKTFGGEGNEIIRSVFQTSDGGYILGGYTNSFGNGDMDMYLVKIDSEGNRIF